MIILYPEYQELYREPRYSIIVNTADRRMTLFRDGKVFKTYPIAIGKPTDSIPTSDIHLVYNAIQIYWTCLINKQKSLTIISDSRDFII